MPNLADNIRDHEPRLRLPPSQVVFYSNAAALKDLVAGWATGARSLTWWGAMLTVMSTVRSAAQSLRGWQAVRGACLRLADLSKDATALKGEVPG